MIKYDEQYCAVGVLMSFIFTLNIKIHQAIQTIYFTRY